MRALPVLLMLPLLLPAAAPASGKTYRWTDERGRVHYGDISAPRSERVEIQPGSGITLAQPTPAELEAATRAQDCERRRDQLASYRRAEEITETDALGKTRSYTADERERLLLRVQQQVQEACADATRP